MALQITDANFEELVNSGKPMVLDFWAEWCGPCRMVSPIIDELATEYEGRVTIGKMNVDENDDVVGQFGIRNIPTVLFFKDGMSLRRCTDFIRVTVTVRNRRICGKRSRILHSARP